MRKRRFVISLYILTPLMFICLFWYPHMLFSQTLTLICGVIETIILLGLVFKAYRDSRKPQSKFKEKFNSNLKRPLFYFIIYSIPMVVFFALFVFTIFNGSLTYGQNSLLGWHSSFDVGSYYLFRNGAFHEVSFAVFRILQVLRYTWYITSVIALSSFFAIFLIRVKNKGLVFKSWKYK